MKNKKTTIKLVSTKYFLQSGNYQLHVFVDEILKRLHFKNEHEQDAFIFRNSDPKDIEAVARLMIEATKLISKHGEKK